MLQGARLRWNTHWTLQRYTVPASGLSCGCIGGRQEVQQHSVGIGCGTHCVVRQDELTKRLVEVRARCHRPAAEPLRFGISIRVECSLGERFASWPEASTTHLVRVSFSRHRIREPGYPARMTRCCPSGETSHREVEAAPEEMDRAHLTKEPGPKELEDAIDLDEHTPEALGRRCVIGGVSPIL